MQADHERWLTFTMDDTTYCLPVDTVREVTLWNRPEPVPDAPPQAWGVINLRGDIVTVLDGQSLLGIPQKEPDDDTRVLTIEVDQEVIGFVVDSVHEIVLLDPAKVEAPVTPQAFMKGTCYHKNDLLVLLTLEDVHEQLGR